LKRSLLILITSIIIIIAIASIILIPYLSTQRQAPVEATPRTMTSPTIARTPEEVKQTQEQIPEDIKSIMKMLPSYYPSDYWRIIQGAKAEGRLTIYSNYREEHLKRLIEEFNKLYPFISVTYVLLPTQQGYERYLSEATSGLRNVDVVQIYDAPLVYDLLQKNLVGKYESPEAQFYPNEYVVPGYVVASLYGPYVITWNSKLVSDDKVPSTLKDLVRAINQSPDFWRGKIAIYDAILSTSGWMHMYFYNVTYPNEWTSLLRVLASAKPKYQWSAGILGDWVGKGDVVLGWTLAGWIVDGIIAKRYPEVKFKLPEDTIINLLFPDFFIARDPPHLNAAKLWIDFVLSKRAQLINVNEFGFISTRKDISPEEVKKEWGGVKLHIDAVKGKMKLLTWKEAAVDLYQKRDYYKETWYRIFVLGG
jgi:iron(III) transport system substrate-binding protein